MCAAAQATIIIRNLALEKENEEAIVESGVLPPLIAQLRSPHDRCAASGHPPAECQHVHCSVRACLCALSFMCDCRQDALVISSNYCPRRGERTCSQHGDEARCIS